KIIDRHFSSGIKCFLRATFIMQMHMNKIINYFLHEQQRELSVMTENILLAFALTLFAGLATGIGSFTALFTKTTNTKFLSFSLGFSAGVMIYVSMIEIFVKAKDSLTNDLGDVLGNWITVAGFFGGMLLIALIDQFVPKQGNPHELKKVEEMNPTNKGIKDPALLKMGTFTALAIGIHNFPE